MNEKKEENNLISQNINILNPLNEKNQNQNNKLEKSKRPSYLNSSNCINKLFGINVIKLYFVVLILLFWWLYLSLFFLLLFIKNSWNFTFEGFDFPIIKFEFIISLSIGLLFLLWIKLLWLLLIVV